MNTKIKVNGIGQMKIKPDTIVLNITLTSEDKEARNAFEKQKQIKKQLIHNLNVLNIKEDKLKTTNFEMHPIYKNILNKDTYEQHLTGYRVTENITLQLPYNIDFLNEVLVAMNDIEDTIQFNINFQNRQNYEKELFDLAYKNALETATILSNISNLKITGIEEIKEKNDAPIVREVMYKASLDIIPEDITFQKEIEVVFLAN